MNKVFARTYQGVLKISMYFMPWRMPKCIEGPGEIKKLPKFIKGLGFNKVLIVTGPHVNKKYHLLDSMYESMKECGLKYEVFDNVSNNPTDIDVYNGVKIYKDSQCQAIIAFGGGSPMDCAKAIGALVVKKNKTIEKLKGLMKVSKKIPVLFAVPTTSGTGSETTITSVITLSDTKHKVTINDPCLIPKYAVLDPELTIALPPKVTAMTGLDALCHAVESFTNHKYNTKLEDDLAKKAIRLIYDNLYECFKDGNNLTARQNMQKAAYYAGRSFTRGCVGYVHSVGHTLGGLYGIPHGLAMGVILPHVMRQYGTSAQERLARLAEVCGMDGNSDAECAEKFISWIEDLNKKMDIPEKFDAIQDKDIDQIISWAMKEAIPLYPTPVVWKKKDFQKLLISISSKKN